MRTFAWSLFLPLLALGSGPNASGTQGSSINFILTPKFFAARPPRMGRAPAAEHGVTNPVESETPLTNSALSHVEQSFKALQDWTPFLQKLKAKVGQTEFIKLIDGLTFGDPDIFQKLGFAYIALFPGDDRAIHDLVARSDITGLNRDVVGKVPQIAQARTELSVDWPTDHPLSTLKALEAMQRYYDRLGEKMAKGDLSAGAVLVLAIAGPGKLVVPEDHFDTEVFNRGLVEIYNKFSLNSAKKYGIEPSLLAARAN